MLHSLIHPAKVRILFQTTKYLRFFIICFNFIYPLRTIIGYSSRAPYHVYNPILYEPKKLSFTKPHICVPRIWGIVIYAPVLGVCPLKLLRITGTLQGGIMKPGQRLLVSLVLSQAGLDIVSIVLRPVHHAVHAPYGIRCGKRSVRNPSANIIDYPVFLIPDLSD